MCWEMNADLLLIILLLREEKCAEPDFFFLFPPERPSSEVLHEVRVQLK